MKLWEIFTPSVKTKTIKSNTNVNDSLIDKHSGTPIVKNKLVKVLGSGLYSDTIEHENEPGVVRKISKKMIDVTKDGYFKFISTIVTNDRLQSNPYLPKIYKIKIYKTVNVEKKNRIEYFYVVQMEKLYPIEQLDSKEMEMITNKALHIKSTPNNKEKIRAPHDALVDTLYNALSYVRYQDDSVGHESIDNTVNIKDPQLKQAILFVKKSIRISGGNDLHEGNLMFRRTSVGPQLVITDPLK